MHCNVPGSSVHGFLQARLREWLLTLLQNNVYSPKQMLGSGLVFLTLREIAATSAGCWEHDMEQCPWSAQHRAGHTLPWREGGFWLWCQRARPACMACLPPDYSIGIGILYAAFILDLHNNKVLSDGKLDRSPSSLTQSPNTKPLMRLNRGTAAARRFERIQVSSASICGSKIT